MTLRHKAHEDHKEHKDERVFFVIFVTFGSLCRSVTPMETGYRSLAVLPRPPRWADGKALRGSFSSRIAAS